MTASRLIEGDATLERDETALAIELHRAECEFLTGALQAAEARFESLSYRPIALPLRAELTRLRAALYITIDKAAVALEVGLEYCRRVGMHSPLRPSDEDVNGEHARMLALLGERTIEDLRDLPVTTDPVWIGAMNVLADLVPAALSTDANLHDLVRLRMANLSFEHGHCDASCYAHVCAIFGHRYGDYDTAFRLGELARYLINEKGMTRFRARAEMSSWHRCANISGGEALHSLATNAASSYLIPPISASACAAYPGLLPVIVDGITKAFNARNLDVADDARIVFGVRLHR